jgi:Tfp pilus assembly protein PilF
LFIYRSDRRYNLLFLQPGQMLSHATAGNHMPSGVVNGSSPQDARRQGRLNSWKEIADYLGKAERTVKRWEQEYALPIHRRPGGGHGSVFALKTELEEWLLSEPKVLAPEPADHPASASGHRSPPAHPPPKTPDLPRAPSAKGRSQQLKSIVPYALLAVAALVLLFRLPYFHGARAYTTHIFYSILGRSSSRTAPNQPDTEKDIAHRLYLLGRFEWSKRTPDSLNRALDDFTQSLVHDPGNAQAYAGLADTYNLLREFALVPENEAYVRAIAAAKKAIELDDSLAEAHRALAFDEVWGNWDFVTGEHEFERAIQLNPVDPIAHLWFANALSAELSYPSALREIDRAQELDPTSSAIVADKGVMLYHAGHIRQAIDLLKHVEETEPQFLSPHRYLAGVYWDQHDYPDYLRESETTAELTHDAGLKHALDAAAEGWQHHGEIGLYRSLYASQEKLQTEGKLSAFFLALTCVRTGRKDEALQLLSEAYEKRDPWFLRSRDTRDLLALQNEPVYRDLWNNFQSSGNPDDHLQPR